MPRVIPTTTDDAIALEELVDRLEAGGFDGQDEENFAAWGGELRKLANNRDFLADLMIEELKQRCDGQTRSNQYSAQVIMLHSASDRFIIRANFWPAMTDSVIHHSGTDPFFYNVPHDHNFSFLTVGYFGPGYWSDYYEYDYDQVVGIPGEAVDLRFVERTRLEQGKVMLYRAHRDVHLQLPADEMSMSINIVETSHSSAFRDQYRFDVENSRVDGILTRTALEPMLVIAAHHGGGEGEALISDFAQRHPSERIRWCALRARAGTLEQLDDRLSLFERAISDPSPLVAAMARREVQRLEAGRAWVESDAASVALQPAA